MATNSNLHMSRAGKTDEFYTQLSTIEDELSHYRPFFKDKVVFCNCDDPYESNFFKYFCINFKRLELKRLICTCYGTSPFAGTQLSLFEEDNIETEPKKAYKIIIDEIPTDNECGHPSLGDVEKLLRSDKGPVLLNGDGDFRSPECVALLDQADICVTNPPFSLMKEYIPLLIAKKKSFIILGNTNHVTFKELFNYFKTDQIWLGYTSGHFWFRVPDYYEAKGTDYKQDEMGQKWRRMGNSCWFTNLDIESRHMPLDLYKKYTPEEYPKYDTYDAINVDDTKSIPCDYFGEIGVPVTFLCKHCKEQFEITGELHHGSDNPFDFAKPVLKGKEKYVRIVIKRKDQAQ